MGTALIVTDDGKAYCKAMGNPEGPHPLACELVGTQLAKWLGLPTLEYAILRITDADVIPFLAGGQAASGPSFVTRAQSGNTWGGSEVELLKLENPDDLCRLVVFDTWTLNCDRYPPAGTDRKPNYDNVFLSRERTARGAMRVIAMDHTHCFSCGRTLGTKLANIDKAKDERVYGLFPAFIRFLRPRMALIKQTLDQLRKLDLETCQSYVDTVPTEWSVDPEARLALSDLIYRRSSFVADNMVEWLAPFCWKQGELKLNWGGDDPDES